MQASGGFGMSEQAKITHGELCLAVAKKFNRKFALYEYKSTAYIEQPDVLVFDHGRTILFEIKMSLSDFRKDQYKDCRKKYTVPMWCYSIPTRNAQGGGKYNEDKLTIKTQNGHLEIELIENRHLGNRRYFVCPWELIPVDKVPEGWGLIYYRNGKFFLKKDSGKFQSNLRAENNLVIHALRRYASGDTTGILVNTYGGEK